MMDCFASESCGYHFLRSFRNTTGTVLFRTLFLIQTERSLPNFTKSRKGHLMILPQLSKRIAISLGAWAPRPHGVRIESKFLFWEVKRCKISGRDPSRPKMILLFSCCEFKNRPKGRDRFCFRSFPENCVDRLRRRNTVARSERGDCLPLSIANPVEH